MIKIAFFDVDGTLIKLGTKELSDKTEKALTKLRQNNVLLCMATGRSYPTIPHFQGIDFDVLLTFNGSYVKSGENIIFKNPLHNEDKNQIIQNLKNMKRAIAISNENFIVTNGTDEDLAQYFAIGNETMIISDDFDKLSQNDIYQIMCACRKQEYERVLEETDKIVKAQIARGADFENGNMIQKVKNMVPLLVPLFISAFRRANDLAMAMEARCYHGGDHRTQMKPLHYAKRDHIAYLVLFVYLVVAIGFRVMGW